MTFWWKQLWASGEWGCPFVSNLKLTLEIAKYLIEKYVYIFKFLVVLFFIIKMFFSTQFEATGSQVSGSISTRWFWNKSCWKWWRNRGDLSIDWGTWSFRQLFLPVWSGSWNVSFYLFHANLMSFPTSSERFCEYPETA